MNIRHLILREILYRKWNFLLAVLAVLAAVGCLAAVLTVLRLHDLATEQLLSSREADLKAQLQIEEASTRQHLSQFEQKTRQRLTKLEDDYRKITVKMGFNILILPEEQNLLEMHAQGYATAFMPESYVHTLADAGILILNHLLPMVQQKVKWQEKERTILLTGVSDEVTQAHRNPKKPLLQPVPRGTVLVGYELHRNLGLTKGQKVQMQGREFTVQGLQPERGNIDDITLWLHLKDAQDLLGKPGQINAIQALECNCAADNRLEDIRTEIRKILPATQVLEKQTQALARAEARNRAKKEAIDALNQEKERAGLALAQEQARAAATLDAERQARAALRAEYIWLATLLIPVVLLGSLVWLALVMLSNVRERQTEIGILRALGLSTAHVRTLFLSRAVLIGLVGSVLGCAAGVLVGLWWDGSTSVAVPPGLLFDPWLLLALVLLTPVLSAIVGGLAAVLAARQDPALILQQS